MLLLIIIKTNISTYTACVEDSLHISTNGQMSVYSPIFTEVRRRSNKNNTSESSGNWIVEKTDIYIRLTPGQWRAQVWRLISLDRLFSLLNLLICFAVNNRFFEINGFKFKKKIQRVTHLCIPSDLEVSPFFKFYIT